MKKIIVISALVTAIAAGGAYAIQPANSLNLRPSGLTSLSGQPQYNLAGTVPLGQ